MRNESYGTIPVYPIGEMINACVICKQQSASNYKVSHMSWSTLVFTAHHDLSKKGYSFIYQIFIKHSLWPGHYSAGWETWIRKSYGSVIFTLPGGDTPGLL